MPIHSLTGEHALSSISLGIVKLGEKDWAYNLQQHMHKA